MHSLALKHIARLTVVGLFISLHTQGQQIEIGGSLGGMVSKNDITPAINPRFIQPALGGFFRYNLTRSFSARFSGTIGSITGDDKYSNDPVQKARNYSFKTPIQDAALDLEYNFLNYKPHPKAQNWTPYVLGGVGLCRYHNAVAVRGGTVTYLLGLGVKYEIKRPWSIGAEFTTRFTRSDYLDAMGERTFGYAITKATQGNPALTDNYSYLSVTVSYTFYKIVCP